MNKFLAEIYEQPKALRDTLDYYLQGDGKVNLNKIAEIWKNNSFEQIVFTGMGSSFFASHAAACMLSKYGISSLVINAGELLHYHLPIITKKTLLVCVSQSGESYEIVKLMEKIPKGVFCIGISNEDNSTLIQKSNEFLLSRAGKEEMTSTKTYISTAMVMFIFTLALAKEWNSEKAQQLSKTIYSVETIIKNKDEFLDKAVTLLGQPSFIQIIGRGPAYASVLQGALMFKEGARTPAAGIYGGEFRHGPLEMVRKGFKAIVLAPAGNTFQQSIKLVEDITKFEGKVILITNEKKEYENPDVLSVLIPDSDEYFFSIPGIIPLQFFVNQLALNSGLEPGYFSRGAKVTMIE